MAVSASRTVYYESALRLRPVIYMTRMYVVLGPPGGPPPSRDVTILSDAAVPRNESTFYQLLSWTYYFKGQH